MSQKIVPLKISLKFFTRGEKSGFFSSLELKTVAGTEQLWYKFFMV